MQFIMYCLNALLCCATFMHYHQVAEEKERLRKVAEKLRLEEEARERERIETKRKLKEREKAWPNRIATEHRPGSYSNIGRLEETRRFVFCVCLKNVQVIC